MYINLQSELNYPNAGTYFTTDLQACTAVHSVSDLVQIMLFLQVSYGLVYLTGYVAYLKPTLFMVVIEVSVMVVMVVSERMFFYAIVKSRPAISQWSINNIACVRRTSE